MTYNELAKLIASEENRILELKKTTGELKDGMHTACALLNMDGGWLIFGVSPTSLKITGQAVSDNTQRELAQALSGLEPAINADIEYVDVPNTYGNKVIMIRFDGWVWGKQPYTYHGVPYYKVESTTKQMPRAMFEERLRAARPRFYAWETMKAEGKGIDDIAEDRVRGAIRLGIEHGRMNEMALGEPLDVVLSKWELLTDGVPNNGAIMLFGKNMQGYPLLRLRMARFAGIDKNEFIDNQQVTGNFFELLEAGMAFFRKHLNMRGKIVGLYRDEDLEIPVAALRESLVNSLCHRQYEKFNLTIGIAIYDDRVEISNPGVFPPSITPESIKLPHDSFPYNLNIATVLYKTSLLENWGTGAKRIMDACKASKLEEPTWSVNGGFITVTFKRSTAEQEKAPSTPQVPPKYAPSTPQVEELVKSCGAEYYSIAGLLETMGKKDRKTFRENYLDPAIEDGAIEVKFPDSPRHPQQRYRLTEQALDWKKTTNKELNKLTAK